MDDNATKDLLQRLLQQDLPAQIQSGAVGQVDTVVAIGVLALIDHALHPEREHGDAVELATQRVIEIALNEAPDGTDEIEAVAAFTGRAFAHNPVLKPIAKVIAQAIEMADKADATRARDARKLLGVEQKLPEKAPPGGMNWLQVRIDASKK